MKNNIGNKNKEIWEIYEAIIEKTIELNRKKKYFEKDAEKKNPGRPKKLEINEYPDQYSINFMNNFISNNTTKMEESE